ncbi:MAG: TIGR01777 family oxidoreductase, partial [Myxococcota bacterium]
VIHLAGESISGLWTAKKRKAIMDSRVLGTKLLANTVARLKQPPRMFLSASGVNTYGPTGDLILTEETPIGNDFLSRVCVAWEAELKPLQEAGIRTAIMRTGVVLSAKGGALQKMLLPFKMGLGGVVGSGKQYMSWISLEDWLYAAHHLMMNEDCDGVFHLVSPQPLTNREYTKVLGRVLRRPTILPAPSFAIKTVLGEMGEALLLGSARAVPNRLEQVGFVFVSPSLEQTLRMTLGKM